MSLTKGNMPALVACRAAGASLSEAGRAAGMSESTVQRRLREPEVMLAVDEARAELTRQALGRIRSLRDQALNRVAEILADPESPAMALRAAEIILRHATATDGVWLQDKVLQLERRLLEAELAQAAPEGTS